MSALLQRIGEVMGLRRAYRETFTSDSGKIVLLHLCKNGCVISPAFVAGDSHTTAYNNGKRDMVLAIMKYVNTNDDELRMAIEQAYKQAQTQSE